MVCLYINKPRKKTSYYLISCLNKTKQKKQFVFTVYLIVSNKLELFNTVLNKTRDVEETTSVNVNITRSDYLVVQELNIAFVSALIVVYLLKKNSELIRL